MNSKLNEKQQGALITVCDRYGFVEELTKFLYKRNMMQNIELYVQQINGMSTPKVSFFFFFFFFSCFVFLLPFSFLFTTFVDSFLSLGCWCPPRHAM